MTFTLDIAPWVWTYGSLLVACLLIIFLASAIDGATKEEKDAKGEDKIKLGHVIAFLFLVCGGVGFLVTFASMMYRALSNA